MLTQEQKKELTRQRLNLRARIREAQAKGKDVLELAKEYNNLLEELKKKGLEIDYRAYLDYTVTTPKSLNFKPIIQQKPRTNNNSTPVSLPAPSQIESKPQNGLYVLNLAWTETSKGTDTKTLEELDSYLKSISEADIYDDSSEDCFEVEHIIKYKYKTTKQAFNVIKQSSIFFKDKISDSSKDSIEIFGKFLGPE